jgi:hypothetical protein
MSQLLNEEIQRMQHLAGMGSKEHAFEILLESFSHLTINELKTRLFEVDENVEEKAADYFENLSDEEQKEAAALAKKIPPSALNLTADEFGDKARKFSKKIRAGAIALLIILGTNTLASPIVTAVKNDNNIKKSELQSNQSQKKLNQSNTANFKDGQNIEKATELNPSLDDPTDGDDAMHVQYKTAGYAIKDQQRADVDKLGDNVVDVVKDGNSVDINGTSGYSNQEDGSSNKAVDGKKLDDARAKSFKATAEQSVEKALQDKNLKYKKTANGFEVKTPKGTKTIKITSDTAKEKGVKNKTGGADQGTVVKTKVVKDTLEKAKAIWQDLMMNPGLPRMPKDKSDSPNKPTEPKTDTDRVNVTDKVGQEPSGTGESKNGQRNTQLAIILNMANDSANTFKELGVPYSTRLTQSVLNKAEGGKAKDLADLIVAIRKNPDYFLKKVSNVTGQSIGQRTKQTNRFAESLQLEALLHEGKIDDLLLKVGITDNDIKANADVIIKSLTKIYGLGSTAPTSSTEPKTPEDTTSTTSTTKDKMSFDSKTLLKDINANTSLKNRLKLIDNDQELIDLFSTLTDYVNVNLNKTQLKSAFTSTSNKVKSMKEEEEKETVDSYAVKDIIEKNTLLKQHLSNINTPQEFSDLLVTMLMFIDPTGKITKDRQRISRLIFSAQNQIKRK